MKITRLAWQNFKGLDDDEILANGNDVIIRGQNGVGKSSLHEVLPFILTGKFSGSIKRYDKDGIPIHDDGLIHAAEVSFDDGTTLRREISWTGNGNTGKRFINGQAASDADFKAAVLKLTHGGGLFVFNPFAFAELKPDKQRAFLMQTFAPDSLTLSDEDFKTVGGKSLDQFISDKDLELKRAQKNVAPLPTRIDELRRQLADAPTDLAEQISNLTAKIGRVQFERDNLQISKHNALDEYSVACNLVANLKSAKQLAEFKLETAVGEREKLLQDYHDIKHAKPGTCPTCGQPFTLETFQLKIDKKKAEICAKGKVTVQNRDNAKLELEKINTGLIDAQKKADSLKQAADEQQQAELKREQELKQVNDQLDALNQEIAVLKKLSDIQATLNKKIAEARQLYQQIESLKGQIQWAKNLRQQQLEDASDKINSHFLNVKFKIFDLVVSTGELKITCEPMLNGVPFISLSKGEKLKAALDIFKAIQDFYDVQLPILLDNAESYTRNSFVELPNQLFLFKVSDDPKLVIDVQKGNRS